MPRKAFAKRKKPEKLAAKLLEIRQKLEESQNSMLRRLGVENEFGRDYVSKWERGLLEPPLLILCGYAQAANVYLEILIKDEYDLPERLPNSLKND